MIYLLTIPYGLNEGVYFYHVMDKKYYYYTTYKNYSSSSYINFLYVFEHGVYSDVLVDRFDKKFDDIWRDIRKHNNFFIEDVDNEVEVNDMIYQELERTLLDNICDVIILK